jgi:hypothetical protein
MQVKNILKKLLPTPSSDVSRYQDFPEEYWNTINSVKEFTMTSPERLFALISAVEYVLHADVPGAFVECGVWRGGSVMAMLETLNRRGSGEREIYLYDTFEGMPPPDGRDVDREGRGAQEQFATSDRVGESGSDWCYADLEAVQRNVHSIRYPRESIYFVKGDVENTIPERAPEQIALLRLDTDWYSSTLHELKHLYPRIQPGGILIIDDYGYWKGAREATDEYFAERGPVFMSRIDNTARLIVKPE